jgi:hypothetical protein
MTAAEREGAAYPAAPDPDQHCAWCDRPAIRTVLVTPAQAKRDKHGRMITATAEKRLPVCVDHFASLQTVTNRDTTASTRKRWRQTALFDASAFKRGG